MGTLIRAHRKGGNVAHLLHSASQPSVCGRVMVYVPGGEGLRLCKTCARLTGVQEDIDLRTQEGLPDVTDWNETEQAFIKGAGDSFSLGMCREVLAQFESDPREYGTPQLLRHVAMMRAALTLHTGRDYKDPEDAPQIKRRGAGDGMVNPNSKSTARQTGANANQRAGMLKQAAFIDSLFSQLFAIQGKEDDQNCTQTARYEKDGFFDSLTREQIDKEFKGNSALIDRLKEEIRKAKQDSPKAVSIPSASLKVGLGDICKLDGEYYKVKVSQTGNPYAMRWDGEHWDYESARGVIRKLKPEHLATAEDAAQFGHMFHRCVFCSRPLADERSEAVGYGPDCAEKRSLPWG